MVRWILKFCAKAFSYHIHDIFELSMPFEFWTMNVTSKKWSNFVIHCFMLQLIVVGGVGFDHNLGYRAKHQVSTTILSTIKVDIKTFSIDLLLFIDNFTGKIQSFTWISDDGIIATAQNLSQWNRNIWSSFRSIDTWTHVFGIMSRFLHPNLLFIFSIWKQIEYICLPMCSCYENGCHVYVCRNTLQSKLPKTLLTIKLVHSLEWIIIINL